MVNHRLARISVPLLVLPAVLLALGACAPPSVSSADAETDPGHGATAAPQTPRTPTRPGAPLDALAAPRPLASVSAPVPAAVPSASSARLPSPPTSARVRVPAAGSALLAEPVSPGGVPFLPPPAAAEVPDLAPDVSAPLLPELSVRVLPTAEPEPSTAPALSVPLGLYVAGGYNGTDTVYTAALQMRGDGMYSMVPASGAEIPDPTAGRAGTYEVLNGSALEFRTGPYAGLRATLVPDYEATGRDFIDLTVDGVFTSFHFEHA